MGKKSKKNKEKKPNPKKLKYAKFKKEKSSQLDIAMPELDEDLEKTRREDDEKVNKYLRFNRNKPPKEIVTRREKDKR